MVPRFDFLCLCALRLRLFYLASFFVRCAFSLFLLLLYFFYRCDLEVPFFFGHPSLSHPQLFP